LAFSSCYYDSCIAGGERLGILIALGHIEVDGTGCKSCDVRVDHGFGKANVMDNTNG